MRTVRTRLTWFSIAIAALVALLGANAPVGSGPGAIHSLAEQGGGAAAGGGTGGTLLSDFGPLIIVGLAIAVIVLLAAVVILIRTRGPVTPPAASEGWWTCGNCGAGNLDGAARCHACSTWRTTTTRATTTPTAQP